MKQLVSFNNVSKQYKLGLTRTSFPVLFSQWLTNFVRPNSRKTKEENILWALENVSFELNKGDSLALIGPNGAGKTTILKLLANITKPTSGLVDVRGKLSALIELGTGFHPDLSGRENIFLNGIILGLRRNEIKQKYDEIVAFSELERFMDTPVKRYSSGMLVRLGFAVASCVEPDILLVDEVLAVGDASFRQKCMQRIQDLLGNGTSIIFVSHNLWMVQAVCKNALFLDKGHVVYRGNTPEVMEVYDQMLNEKRAKKFEPANIMENGEGNEIEITKVEVIGPGSEHTDFYPDQPVEIKLHYLAYQDIGSVNVVIRILRSDGLTCFMLRSQADNVEILPQRGVGLISILIEPLQLRGGSFYVQAIIRDANDMKSITTTSSDWFYVKGTGLSFSSMNGVFEPNRKWAHYPKAVEMISNSYGLADEST
jgi:lipopolysaccharide transport system ATP-binding protein